MPAVAALIDHGTFPATSGPAAEANLLIQSLKVSAKREKKGYKSASTKATTRLRYSDPTLEFDVDAFINGTTGFVTQHPGSAVTTLANFADTYRTFDKDDGVMVFEDPVDDYPLDDLIKTTFKVVHYPFVA